MVSVYKFQYVVVNLHKFHQKLHFSLDQRTNRNLIPMKNSIYLLGDVSLITVKFSELTLSEMYGHKVRRIPLKILGTKGSKAPLVD